MSEDTNPQNNEPQQKPTPSVVENEQNDWLGAYQQEVSRSRKYRRRAQNAELELEQLRTSSLSPEQLAQFENLQSRAEQFAESQQRAGQLANMVSKLAGRDELIKALVACGVGRGCGNGRDMIDQAVCLLSNRIMVDTAGDEPVVTVADPSAGEDPAGRDITVSEFVSDWLTSSGAHFLPPSGDTGSGAYNGPAAMAGQSLSDLDANPGKKANFIATRGLQAYVQLAQSSRQQ